MKLSEIEFKFILNQFRKQTDATLGQKIERVCNKHFYSKFSFLGNITYDEKVYDSIFLKEIYINKYPYTITAMDMQTILTRMTGNGKSAIRPLKTL